MSFQTFALLNEALNDSVARRILVLYNKNVWAAIVALVGIDAAYFVYFGLPRLIHYYPIHLFLAVLGLAIGCYSTSTYNARLYSEMYIVLLSSWILVPPIGEDSKLEIVLCILSIAYLCVILSQETEEDDEECEARRLRWQRDPWHSFGLMYIQDPQVTLETIDQNPDLKLYTLQFYIKWERVYEKHLNEMKQVVGNLLPVIPLTQIISDYIKQLVLHKSK